MYYSAYESERDVSSGLIGPLLICKTGAIDPSTGRQVRDRNIMCQAGGPGEKTQKIGFLNNTGADSLKTQGTAEPAFNVRP